MRFSMCLFDLVVVFLLFWIFFFDKDDDEVVQAVWFGNCFCCCS